MESMKAKMTGMDFAGENKCTNRTNTKYSTINTQIDKNKEIIWKNNVIIILLINS